LSAQKHFELLRDNYAIENADALRERAVVLSPVKTQAALSLLTLLGMPDDRKERRTNADPEA
jgi:hypothetical protein